jgi:GntP family gluconate:H+ symporter
MQAGFPTLIILIGSIAAMILLIARLKFHAFIALILVAIVGGLAFGLGTEKTVKLVADGFGGTLGYIGIVIILGCIIGQILEETGGAREIADTMLRLFGRKRATLAMGATGYIVSIPIFADSGFVILSPIVRALSAKGNIPLVALVGALQVGLVATHSMVPPTPGPLAAAGILKADVGYVILLGLIASIPFVLVGMWWSSSKSITSRYPHVSELAAGEAEERQLHPSGILSFLPIVVPVILIALGSFVKFALPKSSGALYSFLIFTGNPVISLSIGVIFGLWLGKSQLSLKTFYKWCSEGVEKSGFILIATGAAGSFGAILKATDVGPYLGKLILSTGVPSVFVPWSIAALIFVAQGSATVSLLTTSAIIAPMLPTLGLHPAVAVAAIGAGAPFFVHGNCSYFWVVTKLSDNMPLEEGYRVISVQNALGSIAAIIMVFIMSLFITA